MNDQFRKLVLLLLVATTTTTTAAASASASPPSARSQRSALAASWLEQGLQAVPSRTLDLVYARPGARARAPVQVAPVAVELRPDWQRANRDLARARMRPAEAQRLKDEVAAIVAEELQQELASARVAGGIGGPVLEARVLDLFLNAPDLQTAAMTRSYVRSFGDWVLVAELRERPGGTLLFATWDHPPAREFAELRLTTRVENAIELRAAAHAWARQLRREIDRLGAGG